MRVTLLITTFNSISQAYYTYLKDRGFLVDVVYAICDKQMIKEVFEFAPDVVICPFLKKFVPAEIFTKIATYILHPGIIGDKGAYSLDNAIREDKKEWGVVILRANGEFDGGDIYADVNFSMRDTYKASLYRVEVFEASLKALEILLANLKDRDFTPKKQLQTYKHLQLTQLHRKIDWQTDTTKTILKKIYMSDSYPGVLDEILGIECYLYGVWVEDKLRGRQPKEILAKRDGAICISTVDGAIWITHLKEIKGFKLPATYVLKDRLKGIKEDRLPLIFDKSYKTFYEISCDMVGEVAYLYFNFHNGAFRAEQCIRLKYAFEYLKESAKVIVLMGGDDFFSNGINLNILEDSQKNGEDGWSNINAINDLVKTIIFADNVITVASLSKNAGAGGVFLATACDYVVGQRGRVLNPHYKTLGLSGSEYHTYSLTKRVGLEKAKELLEECLPISIDEAFNIKLIDKVFEVKNYKQELEYFVDGLLDDEVYDEFLWIKEEFLEENAEFINSCKEDELKNMYPEFWDKTSLFHTLRYEFVYKICPTATPNRLKGKRCTNTV